MSGEEVNADFHEQLRLQRLLEGGQAEEARGRASTFVDADGTEFEWDCEKKAWFPKITEDFLATYHANYGYIEENPENTGNSTTETEKTAAVLEKSSQSNTPQGDPKESKQKGEKRKVDAGWIDVEEQRNTNVYVSGLPPDITNDEFVELMSKFGIIMQNPETEEYKIKLYKDKDGNLKGDGLCCYLKKESIDLALRFLDETELRGYKLHVEVAKFEMKGQYDASKKKKKSKDYKKKLLLQKKQLDWRPERKPGSSRLRCERVVILKNMFHPKDFEEDPLVLNEIRDDVRLECEKFGQVKKVLLFDRHPGGIASVAFKEPEQADQCILMLNGRWFGGRQITAETWDGVVDYQIEETVKEREYRLKTWESFLEGKSASDSKTTEASGQASLEVSAPPEDSTERSEDKGKQSAGSLTPSEDNEKLSADTVTLSKDNTKPTVDSAALSGDLKHQDVIDSISDTEKAEEKWIEENLSTDSSIDGSVDDAEEEQ
ncbi:HIV Tat-specific factor 1 [Chiloscyllium plagiosum]|uniref:HIV Tat-specific factor 1 n=1 Tax=Chiloscyllium plagiosum TaxID=36176 RepID=UPI001CB80A62|nr:HIV Tat-specific factor 1 [Chiloscyllium plagiosum]